MLMHKSRKISLGYQTHYVFWNLLISQITLCEKCGLDPGHICQRGSRNLFGLGRRNGWTRYWTEIERCPFALAVRADTCVRLWPESLWWLMCLSRYDAARRGRFLSLVATAERERSTRPYGAAMIAAVAQSRILAIEVWRPVPFIPLGEPSGRVEHYLP